MELLKGLWSVNMSKKFTTELSSDLDFEGMIVEVCFDTQPIARLNYDKGIDDIEVELVFCSKDAGEMIFSLDGFLAAVEKARKLIIQCAEEDKLKEKE